MGTNHHLSLLALLTLLAGCISAERFPTTGRVEQFDFPSTRLDDTFRIFVRLPPDYEAQPNRRFPMVLQLDANLPIFMEFDVTAGVVSKLESTKASSPTIVIGIGYRSADEAKIVRFRDLGLPIENETFGQAWNHVVPPGQAPQFYDFIRDELMPSLESRYRIAAPDGRALFGHSMGGLFVLYAATRHDEAPLFGNYVAASPSIFWDAGQILTRWQQHTGPVTPALLFTAAGQLEGPEMMVYFDEFNRRVLAREPSALVFGTHTFQTDHVGSTTPSFQAGLEFLVAHGFGAAP